jgi:hypothetical protein
MHWQPDSEGGSLPHFAVHFDPSAVIANDSLHHHQSQAGTFFLGGEKRLEDPVQLFLGYA